ncbi:hypothetical protein ACFY1U_21685 [Streptomyces sp. NPDC001351]|uniref:hypothetical protein n=1 Tax=Streptomyces sp. NPDC001351 TaxID=3364564 RepID=UPI0036921473
MSGPDVIDLGRIRLDCVSLAPVAAPALLLVHGWGGDGREWAVHAEALAAPSA